MNHRLKKILHQSLWSKPMSLTRKNVHVEMTLVNRTILKGTLVIDRTTRLSDTLNKHNKDFLVLSDYEGIYHIINKHHVIKVVEVESIEFEE
ncbi:hypothetical protein BGP_5621 [Beggiatoa sp. PS]|nr:hypothetical protein BGP_5621 [Beggiatoa sp. PS]